MKDMFAIFVEGIADEVFFKQYLHHLFGITIPDNRIQKLDGWTNLKVINPNNRPIMDCWEDYEKELVKLDIPGRTPPPLTTPAKKTKIYGYLEALLGTSKHEKELIKEKERDYENTLHWNLDAEYLEPLREFLISHLGINGKETLDT